LKAPTIYDAAIIGGGLAGLTLAIQLAKQGYQVILFEKENYPFNKVCGEYISLESWPFLEQLGLPLGQLNLPIINKLLVTDIAGNAYNFNLPQGGFGISRYKLDELLYNIAVQNGVQVLTQTKVVNIDYANNHFSITTSAGLFAAKQAAGCYGKRSNIDVKWNRTFLKNKVSKLNNYIGIKYHIKYSQAADIIALHNFKNGYCGMSQIEDDKYCLCYLTTAKNLKQANNSIAQLETSILATNPFLKNILSTATYLFKEPLTISQVSFSKKLQVENHVLMLGDAAGMITPLCGNGMSMAMHASKIAFTLMHRFLQQNITQQQLETLYTAQWKKQFARRLWIGRNVQRIFGNNKSTTLFFKIMKAIPALAKLVIKQTHGKPF
jgi:menaquinone-9 beta-reductase